MNDFDIGTTLRHVRRTSTQLMHLSGSVRNLAIEAMAKSLIDHLDQLLEANTLDLESLRERPAPEWVLEGVKLTPERLQRAVDHLEQLAQQPDPVGIVDQSQRLDQGVVVNRYRIPIGVLALLYEIHPEFAIIGLGMALKTGNGVVIASSDVTRHTHDTLISLLSRAAYKAGIPEGVIQSIPGDDLLPPDPNETPALPVLQQSRYIDLVIPYGRPSWVEQVELIATVPVLKTQLGHGHAYVDASISWQQFQTLLLGQLGRTLTEGLWAYQPIVLWLLLHCGWAEQHLAELITELTHRGLAIQVGADIQAQFPHLPAISDRVDSAEQPHVRLQIVETLETAITWINKHGNGSWEGILSDSHMATQQFVREVNAATLYVNSSPLMLINLHDPVSLGLPREIALGISTQKLHVRGPIDLEALTTVKYVTRGGVLIEGSADKR